MRNEISPPTRSWIARTASRRTALRGLGTGLAVVLGLAPGVSHRRRPLTALAAPATPAAATLSPPLGANFVGRTSDPETFVALVLRDEPAGDAVAYLCAGADLSLWFTGHVQDGALRLSGPDPREMATPDAGWTLTEPAPTLVGQRGPDGISGEARLPDLTLTFDAIPAEGLAGFYVAERDAAGIVRGAASTGATLAARQVPAADAGADDPFLIAGTVTLADGTEVAIAIPAHSEGPITMRWVALADGAIRGAGRRPRASDGERDEEEFVSKLLD